MAKPPIRWSYSQLATYERCPLAWRFAYLDRLPRPPRNAYAQRGTDIHAELETFLKKPRARAVPASLAALNNDILAAKAAGAVAEAERFFDRTWTETTEDRAWGLIKVDVHWVEGPRAGESGDTLHVRDLKSGRVRDYTDQVRIYLAGLIDEYPAVTRGVGGIWYCDQPPTGRPVTLSRQQLVGVQKELAARVARLERDTTFKPKPGVACRYCDFSYHRGGPCQSG